LLETHSPTPPAAVDVILRDGTTLRLRAPVRGDTDALVAFFDRLSEHSVGLPEGYVAVDARVRLRIPESGRRAKRW